MGLTRQMVENIAELAKLHLSEDELGLFSEQLSEILEYVDMLSVLDTEDIPPTASVLPLQNAFRDDIAHIRLTTAEALANAPQQESQQFRVMAVLDQDE
ncbi:MAG: Asp-tRNA(Asn)/Glu-tRNA(Gln) amidotransferase subunit GatC [Anaerolineales bacterium]